jgi:hypothetical protein
MGDSAAGLVNARIALADAPEAARSLYRRPVDLSAIEPQLRDDVPFSLGWVFPRGSRNDIVRAFIASRSK